MSQTADQVQRLVQQALGEFEQQMSSDEKPSSVLTKMMETLLRTTQGVGAVAWMFKDPEHPEFTSVAQVGPASPLVFDPEGRIQTPVREVLQQSASQGKPIIVAPDQPDFQKTDLHNTCQFIVPIDAMGRTLGVVQLIHTKDLDPKVYRQFVMFTQQASRAAGLYLARRQSNVLREDLDAATRMLKMSHQLVKVSTPEDLIHELANLARNALKAQRMSAVGYWRNKTEVAFSDTIEVNRKAVVVRTVELLAEVVRDRRVPMVFLRDQELEPEEQSLLPLLEDLYSHGAAEAIVLTPLMVDKKVVGVLIGEYDDAEEASARSATQSEVAGQAAPLLNQVVEWRYRPLRRTSDLLASIRRRPMSSMGKVAVAVAIVWFVIHVLFFVPMPVSVFGEARLEPAKLALITAPEAGRISDVKIVNGEAVERGQVLATMDDIDLKLELAEIVQKISGERVELEASRREGDRPKLQASQLRIEQYQLQKQSLERKIERAQVRTPIGGVVLDDRPQRLIDRTVAQGDELMSVADLTEFELVIDLHEEDLAAVEEAIRDGKEVEVSFLSRPWPDLVQHAKVTNIEQLSPTSRPDEYQKQHVFRIIVPIELEGLSPQLVLANPTGRAKLITPPRSIAYGVFGGVWRFLKMTLFF